MLEILIDPLFKVIEQQGIIAGLLILQMYKNSTERRELLAKNCELNRFIMGCLKQKLDEDSPLSGPFPGYPKSSNSDDLPTEGIITHPANNAS